MFAPVYDYRWGSGTKQLTDHTILNNSKKFIIKNGKKLEINHIPKIGEMGVHGGVRGSRQITYH
jgi:hypothetical protein